LMSGMARPISGSSMIHNRSTSVADGLLEAF
jgi:hypothetical protein